MKVDIVNPSLIHYYILVDFVNLYYTILHGAGSVLIWALVDINSKHIY